MSQLAMTDDGDIFIANNKFSLVNRKAEVRQRLIQNLRTFFSEWFLDKTLGVPYHQIIFEKGTPQSVIESLFIDEIIKSNGVANLLKFDPLDLDVASRTLSINFEVSTIFGSVTVETLVP